ncbi:MAG: N-acetyl-gamma-glutamyl-phosphate reductase [Calditrichaceae bacterium]|nr:N-acetyl-gamma-glutamyl-phosphate reductase [Calditrichaceae bacterium]MBN2710569.1 N-acetyl-gamma-glutamyl-phosphate reductase [Calditrichaceae bacterium]RQV94111.1 MAG: N-acetyl-gamma-glutamyl-phosphate reductase [Calditrichota bacterium]
MIRAGIIGGAGFTGGEMTRILLRHPECELAFVQSNSQAGKMISSTHTDLVGETDMKFVKETDYDVDCLFLCLAHGDSVKYVRNNNIPENTAIIDLSQDFRLKHINQPHNYVYGLPEAYREQIKSTKQLANPGCFATGIELAFLPLAANKLLSGNIHVTAVTGSTGAGQKLSDTVHFTWRSSNVSFYKIFEHQHQREIGQILGSLQPDWSDNVYFVPMRGNFTRGILTGLYTKCSLSIEEITDIYKNHYAGHPFTIVVDKEPDIKQIVNTNKCLVHLKKKDDILFVTTVIDNLIKGASGQAVQNMNLMFGLDETCGLYSKPVAF